MSDQALSPAAAPAPVGQLIGIGPDAAGGIVATVSLDEDAARRAGPLLYQEIALVCVETARLAIVAEQLQLVAEAAGALVDALNARPLAADPVNEPALMAMHRVQYLLARPALADLRR